MSKLIRNIEHGVVLSLVEQVDYLPGQIVSKTLSQNNLHSLTLFAFDQGEEISTHASEGDALLLAIDGEGQVTIGGETHMLSSGEVIIMPAGIPHAVLATERFKMLLSVSFSA